MLWSRMGLTKCRQKDEPVEPFFVWICCFLLSFVIVVFPVNPMQESCRSYMFVPAQQAQLIIIGYTVFMFGVQSNGGTWWNHAEAVKFNHSNASVTLFSKLLLCKAKTIRSDCMKMKLFKDARDFTRP